MRATLFTKARCSVACQKHTTARGVYLTNSRGRGLGGWVRSLSSYQKRQLIFPSQLCEWASKAFIVARLVHSPDSALLYGLCLSVSLHACMY